MSPSVGVSGAVTSGGRAAGRARRGGGRASPGRGRSGLAVTSSASSEAVPMPCAYRGAGEGRGHRQAGRQPDRGLQGAGDDHRDAGRQLGGVQGGGDAPDPLGLDDQHVRGVQAAHLDHVLHAADRHLGGDRHRAAAAERGQVAESGRPGPRPARSPRRRAGPARRPPRRRLQEPLASTRIRTPGPTASRTARTRASPSRSPTLTFTVAQPESTAIRAASRGATRGIMVLTSTAPTTGSGKGWSAASSAPR